MMMRYLRWTGIKAEIFNVGNFRRKMDMSGVGADFFDKNNTEAQAQREQLALDVQEDMYKWLHAQDDLAVAFFDATNTTRERRAKISARARLEPNVVLLFVESICDDPEILARNYGMKLQNNDYKGMVRIVPPSDALTCVVVAQPKVMRVASHALGPLTRVSQEANSALSDFKLRVAKYEDVYEEIIDDEDGGKISYIKLFNVGRKVVTHRCAGYLPSQVGCG
jgi:hypothetical protein